MKLSLYKPFYRYRKLTQILRKYKEIPEIKRSKTLLGLSKTDICKLILDRAFDIFNIYLILYDLVKRGYFKENWVYKVPKVLKILKEIELSHSRIVEVFNSISSYLNTRAMRPIRETYYKYRDVLYENLRALINVIETEYKQVLAVQKKSRNSVNTNVNNDIDDINFPLYSDELEKKYYINNFIRDYLIGFFEDNEDTAVYFSKKPCLSKA